jgi:hypothetical protein
VVSTTAVILPDLISLVADIHCIQLVHEGVAEKLLQLLERIKDDGDDEGSPGGLGKGPTLQHAVLSALRNLAIPGAL